MLLRSLNVIGAVWMSMFLGAFALLLATVAGWRIAREASLPPVRLVHWWVRRVIRPLLIRRSWWVRAGAIFLNNASLLAILAALGRWPWTALAGVAGLGVSLGIGLRILSSEPDESVHLNPKLGPSGVRRVRVGVALNLLEPPAIILTIGLSLGQSASGGIPLSSVQVWETFAVWVIPATLIAAGGEALWLGACQDTRSSSDTAAQENTNAYP